MHNFTKASYLVVLVGLLLLPLSSKGQSYQDILRAVESGDTKATEALLDRGLDPDTIDPSGHSLLMLAARAGDLDMARALIRRKANVRARSPHGDSALMMAALGGKLEVVNLLLANGAELNHGGWTPLHYAAFHGQTEVLQALLSRGAEINALAPNRYTSLMLAARGGKLGAVQALLHADADFTIQGAAGETALGIAIERKQEEVAALLRRAGAVK